MYDNFTHDGADEPVIEIHTKEIQEHKLLTVSGEIDAFTAPHFSQALKSFVERNANHLIIDMHNVRYMDSSGLNVLFFATERLSPKRYSVNLVSCNPPLIRILTITQLNQKIAVHPNMDDAMQSLYS